MPRRAVSLAKRFIATIAAAAVSFAFAAETFKRLTTHEIRSRIVGKVVTDEAHWADHFHKDGTLVWIDLGNSRQGSWRVEANELCITRESRKATTTDCYEIWNVNDRIEYRRDGVVIAEGVLRSQ